MNYLRRGLVWRLGWLLSLVWLLACATDAVATTGEDANGTFYYRQSAQFVSGCVGTGVASTFNGSAVSGNCPNNAGAATSCAAKGENYEIQPAGTGNVAVVASTFQDAFTYEKVKCVFLTTGQTSTTYTNTIKTCPLNAPIVQGAAPSVTCTCEGTVIDGKCYAPPDPCSNAPTSIIVETVPLYQIVDGFASYTNANTACESSGCNTYESFCAMNVDQPDVPGEGCNYAPAFWQTNIAGATWDAVYTLSGSGCTGTDPTATTATQPPQDSVPPDQCDPATQQCLPALPANLCLEDGTCTGDTGSGTGGGDTGGGDTGGGTGGGDTGGGTGGGTCDPATDPTCDTGGGTGGGTCDPATDPTCDTGTCDPATQDCGTCDPATETCCDPADPTCSEYGADGWYQPSYTGGFEGVYSSRVNEFQNAPLMASVASAFTVDFAGQCPHWEIQALGHSYMVSVQCDPQFDFVYTMLSTVVLLYATMRAVRTALE